MRIKFDRKKNLENDEIMKKKSILKILSNLKNIGIKRMRTKYNK